MFRQLFQLVAFVAACQAAAVSSKLNCKELLIPVDVSAKNLGLPSNLTISDISLEFLQSLGPPKATVKGSFHIGARYCEPVKQVAGREHTLQVLVHGITYTRDYWSGLAAPGTKSGQDQYSWILYAADQGFATLSIDRLCNGASSRPDGISACQVPLQSETVHALITMARAGKLPKVQKQFGKIVLVGHSDGSVLADYLAVTHPRDADALLLTGYSFNLTNGLGGSANLGLKPAATILPDRFGKAQRSYLVFTNRTAVQEFFYFGRFEESIVDYDYAHRGTVTVGEFASILLGQLADRTYRGKTFVLNGEEDAAFCEESIAAGAAGKPGNCSAGFSQAVKKYFPASSGFGYFNTPQTGHCLNLHLTAQQSYRAAHDFLAKSGF